MQGCMARSLRSLVAQAVSTATVKIQLRQLTWERWLDRAITFYKAPRSAGFFVRGWFVGGAKKAAIGLL